MAPQNQNNPQDEAPDFELVDSTFQTRGGANRDDAGGTVSPTGLTKLNAGGSDDMDQMAFDQGLQKGRYCLIFGANPATGLVAIYTVKVDTPNAMPVREATGGGTAHSFHIGAVFQKYPSLRPVGDSWCHLTRSTDRKGRPCLIMPIQAPLPVQHTTRNGSAATTSKGKSQPAEGQ